MWALRDVPLDLGLVSRQHRRGQGSACSVAVRRTGRAIESKAAVLPFGLIKT